MGVESYLELYSTYMGWMLYGTGWNLIYTLGMVHIAAAVLLWNSWKESSMSSYAHRPAAPKSLQTTQFEIGFFFFVVLVFGVPAVSLDAHKLAFVPPPTIANPHPGKVDRSNTGTTYDNSYMAKTGDQLIPWGWASIMAFSAGITHAFRATIPKVDNFRAIQDAVASSHIEDPVTRSQVRRFTAECWVPARNKWKHSIERYGMPDDVRKVVKSMPGFKTSTKLSDMNHIESEIFQQVPGFYHQCPTNAGQPGPAWCPKENTFKWAGHPVPGWEGYVPQKHKQLVGQPSCKVWWQGSGSYKGLRDLLLDPVRDDVDAAAGIYRRSTADRYEVENEIIRGLLTRSAAEFIPNDYAYYNTASTGDGVISDAWRGVSHVGKQVFGLLGTAEEAVKVSTTMNVILMALPMVQALVLFAIYVMLPWLLLFSRFSGTAVFAGAMAIFTIKFWSALWAVAYWMDQNLIEVMYPGTTGFAVWTGGGGGTKRMLLDMFTTGMYVGLPVIWTVAMGWAGISAVAKFDNAMDSMGDGGKGASSAGSGAGSQAGKTANVSGRTKDVGGKIGKVAGMAGGKPPTP